MGALSLAGAVSGAGQAAVQGLSQVGNYLAQSALWQQRLEWERERMNAEQAFQTGLTERKIAADQANTQATIGAQLVGRGIDAQSARERTEMQEAGATQRTERTVSAQETTATLERGLKRELGKEELGLKKEEVQLKKEALTKELALANRKLDVLVKEGALDRTSREKIAQLTHDTDLKNFELSQRKKAAALRDKLVAAVEEGDTGKIGKLADEVSALEGKPWEERTVDATTAANAMRTVSMDIDRLETQLTKVIPGTPEYDRIQRQIDQLRREQGAYSARIQELSGVKSQQPMKFSITDPMDLSIKKESPEAARGAINR